MTFLSDAPIQEAVHCHTVLFVVKSFLSVLFAITSFSYDPLFHNLDTAITVFVLLFYCSIVTSVTQFSVLISLFLAFFTSFTYLQTPTEFLTQLQKHRQARSSTT